MEATFKNETVGLVTRAEFLSKRDTLRERMDEATAAAKRERDHAADQVGLLRLAGMVQLHHIRFQDIDKASADAKHAGPRRHQSGEVQGRMTWRQQAASGFHGAVAAGPGSFCGRDRIHARVEFMTRLWGCACTGLIHRRLMLDQEKLERQRKKAKAAAKTKLSFGLDDEEEEQEDEVSSVSASNAALEHRGAQLHVLFTAGAEPFAGWRHCRGPACSKHGHRCRRQGSCRAARRGGASGSCQEAGQGPQCPDRLPAGQGARGAGGGGARAAQKGVRAAAEGESRLLVHACSCMQAADPLLHHTAVLAALVQPTEHPLLLRAVEGYRQPVSTSFLCTSGS